MWGNRRKIILSIFPKANNKYFKLEPGIERYFWLFLIVYKPDIITDG